MNIARKARKATAMGVLSAGLIGGPAAPAHETPYHKPANGTADFAEANLTPDVAGVARAIVGLCGSKPYAVEYLTNAVDCRVQLPDGAGFYAEVTSSRSLPKHGAGPNNAVPDPNAPVSVLVTVAYQSKLLPGVPIKPGCEPFRPDCQPPAGEPSQPGGETETYYLDSNNRWNAYQDGQAYPIGAALLDQAAAWQMNFGTGQIKEGAEGNNYDDALLNADWRNAQADTIWQLQQAKNAIGATAAGVVIPQLSPSPNECIGPDGQSVCD